ncbi:MAG: BatD family protein [Candidatus Brocadia sp.]|nr:BatD family protein [Candidatus Brocadia sp.]
MIIKRHNLFLSILLILVLVDYTLIFSEDTASAQGKQDAETATSVEASVQVDKNEATIGDKIKFEICVRYKGDIAVEFPEFNQQLGVFTIKGTGVVEGPKSEKDGYSIAGRNYVLSSYEIGRQTIPPLKIRYKGENGDGEVVTNEVTIDIKGVLKEGEIAGDIKDIFPPVDVPTSFHRLFTWMYGGVAALAFSGIIYWLFRKWKTGKKRQVQEFRTRAPHEVAYELLERLSKEDLIAKGLIREYYYRITDIVRHYIEDQFGLSAPERTTEEFLIEMSHTYKLDDAHKRLIREFLVRCDMVKYARYGPSVTEIKETYDAAKRLIDETRESLKEMEGNVQLLNT